MDELSARVHNLPAELFNKVYEFVFTAPPGRRPINQEYKPPALLQVDRQSRQLFAQTFYGCDSIFVSRDLDQMQRWLESLNREHRAAVKRVHYSDDLIERDFTPKFERFWKFEFSTMRNEVMLRHQMKETEKIMARMEEEMNHKFEETNRRFERMMRKFQEDIEG